MTAPDRTTPPDTTAHPNAAAPPAPRERRPPLPPLPESAAPGAARPVPESTPVLARFSLTGRVALVTGASRGLGLAMARALGQAGAVVAVTARNTERAQAAADELAAEGITAMAVELEVGDPVSVDAAVTAVEAGLGPIGILVNNAGGGHGGRALDAPDEAWRSVMSANLDGTFYCSRAVARRMADRRRGVIVNIGSMSGQVINRPRWQAWYMAAKAGVHQLTKALAAEWAEYGIRVNAIAPGYFLTDISPVNEPQYLPWCVTPAPLGRWGEPHELGPLAVYLASDASAFMTGSIVTIDGGYTLF